MLWRCVGICRLPIFEENHFASPSWRADLCTTSVCGQNRWSRVGGACHKGSWRASLRSRLNVNGSSSPQDYTCPSLWQIWRRKFSFCDAWCRCPFPMVIYSSLWDCRSFITHTWSCMYILDEGVVVGKGEVKAGSGFRSCYIGLMLDESVLWSDGHWLVLNVVRASVRDSQVCRFIVPLNSWTIQIPCEKYIWGLASAEYMVEGGMDRGELPVYTTATRSILVARATKISHAQKQPPRWQTCFVTM